MATVSSMVFLAQFILSSLNGSLVHITGTPTSTVVFSAILSCCGAFAATKVTYVNLWSFLLLLPNVNVFFRFSEDYSTIWTGIITWNINVIRPVLKMQVVHFTFERLWNLARDTFTSVWSLSNVFISKKFSYEIITKDLIWKFSETATPWVFDETWWNLASQVRPNVPSTNLSSVLPTFVSIVNFIFPCVCKWNDSEIKLFQGLFNRN